jgi:transcriptional regulator GlxA family with amidase domain
MDRSESADELDPLIMRAVFRLLRSRGELRVSLMAEGAGLSARQFRRRFRASVGLSPKELARLRRLRTSAASLVATNDPWVELAAGHGYADQAHLVREYRALLGVTPTVFRNHVGRIEHGRILS